MSGPEFLLAARSGSSLIGLLSALVRRASALVNPLFRHPPHRLDSLPGPPPLPPSPEEPP
jgi:hypothetical protein